MKRLLLVLAGYALYRWWTKPPAETNDGPPIALPPPRESAPQRRKPSQSKAA